MATLYVVATPIGNLDDITLRALDILRRVDFIACEDTRVTKRLLEHYEVEKPLISFHQHSSDGKIKLIVDELKSGKNVALVSDAGTPTISDPGGKLVDEVSKFEDIEIIAIPGPSAVIAALSVSGLPVDRFSFWGFVPHKKGRQTFIRNILEQKYPVVLYESVHRIEKLLNEFVENNLDRKIIVCRELTKKFETIYRGKPAEVLIKLQADKTKGEFVVVVEGK